MIDYKKAREFGTLELLAKQVVEGFITGLHKSPFHGFSVEFAEHRLYNTGESTRHIDWKLFARSEKLFIKRYEEETNLRCQIVVDSSSSMQFPSDQPYNKLSFSITSVGYSKNIIYRNKAKINDNIYVTGNLGDSFTGLKILKKQIKVQKKSKYYFINKYYQPDIHIHIVKKLFKFANTSLKIRLTKKFFFKSLINTIYS